MSMADRLARLMEERGVTATEIAVRYGVTPQAISSALAKGDGMAESSVLRFAEFFAVSPAWLRYGAVEAGGDFYDGALDALGRAAEATGRALRDVTEQFRRERSASAAQSRPPLPDPDPMAKQVAAANRQQQAAGATRATPPRKRKQG